MSGGFDKPLDKNVRWMGQECPVESYRYLT